MGQAVPLQPIGYYVELQFFQFAFCSHLFNLLVIAKKLHSSLSAEYIFPMIVIGE